MFTYHMFLQVGLAGKAQATCLTVIVPLALIVHCSPVILQRALVAERRRAQVTMKDLAGVRGQHVASEAGAARKGRLAGGTAVRLVRGVRLPMAGQRFLVLEGGTALRTRVSLGLFAAVVQAFVDGQVVLA